MMEYFEAMGGNKNFKRKWTTQYKIHKLERKVAALIRQDLRKTAKYAEKTTKKETEKMKFEEDRKKLEELGRDIRLEGSQSLISWQIFASTFIMPWSTSSLN